MGGSEYQGSEYQCKIQMLPNFVLQYWTSVAWITTWHSLIQWSRRRYYLPCVLRVHGLVELHETLIIHPHTTLFSWLPIRKLDFLECMSHATCTRRLKDKFTGKTLKSPLVFVRNDFREKGFSKHWHSLMRDLLEMSHIMLKWTFRPLQAFCCCFALLHVLTYY